VRTAGLSRRLYGGGVERLSAERKQEKKKKKSQEQENDSEQGKRVRMQENRI